MDLSGIRETLPEVEEPPKKLCAVCQAPAEKSCGACHQIDYCSAEHQKSHWKEHKKDCPPIKIVNSPQLGPHFVATRDFPPGTLLLTEFPVLVNPFVLTLNDRFIATCISCRSILPTEPWPCFQCSTPHFCNLACSMNKIHTEFECGILYKCNEKQKQNMCIPPYLGYLRAINLKNKDPQTWAKVLNLRGAGQYKLGDEDENDKWFIREILSLVGEKGVGFEADMAKLTGILQQKGILDHLVGNIPKLDHGESQLLYLEASNFAQNCFPNCTPIIGKGPKFQLHVRSTVSVKKGTITSIDYEGVSHDWGAMVRQHEIDLTEGALCICPRCSDPTELGTMLSAVKCMDPNCKDGYLLSVDVKDMAKNAPWRCNRSGCKKSSTWGEIDAIHKGLHNRANTFLASLPLGDVERMVEFLASLRKKLHPNHWFILSFKIATIDKIISYLEMEKITLSIPGVLFYISLIEDLLKMTEFTAPGLNISRGHLWTKILCILMVKLNAVKLGSDSCPKGLENEFKRRANEAIDQFCSIAKFYPEVWTKKLIEDNKKMKLSL